MGRRTDKERNYQMIHKTMKKMIMAVVGLLAIGIFACAGCGSSQDTTGEIEDIKEEAEESADETEAGEENQDNSETNWRHIYKQLISSSAEEWSGYGLLYIDDNDTPELYMVGNSVAQGDRLYSISDGELVETVTATYGLIYWEYQGIFLDEGGQMDAYWDTFYKMENGAVTKIHQGTYGAEDNTSVETDSSGNPIYHYYWDETEVSTDEYYKQYDAISGSGTSFFGYEKIESKSDILARLEESSLGEQRLYKAVDGTLNIRSLPQHDSELVDTVEDADEILYYSGMTGQGFGSDGVMHDWYKITTEDGTSGWVRSDLVWEEQG